MATQQEIINELHRSVKNVEVSSITSKTIRVDIPVNSVSLRLQKTKEIMALFANSAVTKDRPYDIKIPGGFTILVKPAKTARKVGSRANYGLLEKIDFSDYNLTKFVNISREFAGGNLVSSIKEASDVKVVSDLNEEIQRVSGKSLDGITLKINGFTFNNVIGTIPVTNGEPKADIVLVCKDKGKGELYPDGFISYKMGSAAKDFQNYSGLSEKSSPYIFNHNETYEFFKMLSDMSNNNIKEDIYRPIIDKHIIGLSVWGSDFGKAFGINNCHFIAQGEVSIMGQTLNFTHTQKNGDFQFDRTYEPVFGARYAANRGNKGPRGLTAQNFRIGIFPRAYRSKWLA